jgi:hypothetical protein
MQFAFKSPLAQHPKAILWTTTSVSSLPTTSGMRVAEELGISAADDLGMSVGDDLGITIGVGDATPNLVVTITHSVRGHGIYRTATVLFFWSNR